MLPPQSSGARVLQIYEQAISWINTGARIDDLFFLSRLFFLSPPLYFIPLLPCTLPLTKTTAMCVITLAYQGLTYTDFHTKCVKFAYKTS